MSLVTEFRDFILRGNVVDLAVGVVIGAAFTGVVTAFTKDLLTPLIGIAGKTNFADYAATVNNSRFLIGDFFNTVISFLLTASVVYFFVVKPVNWLVERQKAGKPNPSATVECPFCCSKVPARATRCSFCTSELTPTTPAAAAVAAEANAAARA